MKKRTKIMRLFRKHRGLYRCFLFLSIFVLVCLFIVFLDYKSEKKYGRISSDRLPYTISDDHKKFKFEIKENGVSVFQEIVYADMTRDEVVNQINKSLKSTLAGTGEYFVDISLEKGIDPYTAVAISLYETGCKWGCSRLVKECYNLGGIKGKPSCDGTSFKRYDSLEAGIEGFLNVVEYYFDKGMNTPEKMAFKYANGSTTWAEKVNSYIKEIKSK